MKYFISNKEATPAIISHFKPILIFATTQYEHCCEGIERWCEGLRDIDEEPEIEKLRKELDEWFREWSVN